MMNFEGAPPPPPRIVRSIADLDAVQFAQQFLGLDPDEHQKTVLLSDAKRGILNCSRQWGKSTILAAKAIHRAFSQKGKLVLVASPSLRQSAEFLMKAGDMLRRLGVLPRGDGYNRHSLLLPNGSRIVALPGKEATVRGFSAVSLVLIDEAARVDDNMYKALRPMLAVGNGDLWMMSTPRGKRGFFYQTWAYGNDKWFKLAVPAIENPRIPKDFLEEERSEMGSMWFAQEYQCEFIDSGGTVFNRELLEAAIDESILPLQIGNWR